jgi:hypothetical protein
MATTPSPTYPTTSPAAFAGWGERLQRAGYTVLANSHAVPVELWLREPGGAVLVFRSRGTRVTLRRYAATDLTGMLLRSECDCAAHREAGAARRATLAPGATPLDEAAFDGADELGWVGYQAGLLDVASASMLFERLLRRLPPPAAAVLDGGPDQEEAGWAVA